MPELPDIEAYLHALGPRVLDHPVRRVRITSPSLLRTFDPPAEALENRRIIALRRIGKRIAFLLEDDLAAVLHLMIAGRLRWLAAPARGSARVPARLGLAAIDFDTGSLLITEAGTKKRAALHILARHADLAGHDPGGIEPLDAEPAAFAAALRRENHTLKRALTDPRLLAGIGNAFSDEILHAARLSPVTLTSRLTDEQIARLHSATQQVLRAWTAELCRRFEKRFPGPGDVTAFRPEFAVHGKFGRPCPVCNTPVQRIRYADNETNYCPGCQTAGRVLADRSLSRLLRDDWPRTVDELESRERR